MRDTVKGHIHRARIVEDEPCQVCGVKRGEPCVGPRKRPRLPHMLLQRGPTTYSPTYCEKRGMG